MEAQEVSHGRLMLVKGDNPDAGSIAAARQAQLAERQAVTEATGLRITDDGHVRPSARVLVGQCRKCGQFFGRDSLGELTNALAAHIVAQHNPTSKGVA